MEKQNLLKALGQRIKERRTALGMSQESLAFALGYKSRTSINKIELGKTDIVQSTIVKLADSLKTTPAYLLGWDDEYVDNEFNKTIGKKISDARTDLKMSRAVLGEKVNLSENTIKHYEEGHVKNLDVEKLKELASVLMVPAPCLMGWEDVSWAESSTGVIDTKNELEMLISRIESSSTTMFGDASVNDSAKAILKNSLEGLLKNMELIVSK